MKELLELLKENPKLLYGVGAVFSTLLFGSGTSLHEAYMAFSTGSAWGKSSYALEQKKLFETNIECMQNSKFHYITNTHNVEIGTIVCETGDVLISAQKPNDKHPSFKWVSWNDVSSENISLNIISEANAATIIDSYYEDGYLVKEMKQLDGSCIKLFLDPHNGQVVYSESCDDQ